MASHRKQSIAYTPEMSELPAGWSIERIVDAGIDWAALVPISTDVFEESVDDYLVLHPSVIVNCAGLHLVLDTTDQHWHMGQMDDQGTIICWGSYGPDLGEAIEAL